MAYNKETALQLESLYRQHLEEAFQGTHTFGPITVEMTQNMFDRDAFHVTAAYSGDGRLLDPARLNRISSIMMTDKAAELDIENTVIESYVDGREYAGQVARVEEPLDEISGNQDWHGMLNLAGRLLDTGGAPDEVELASAVDRCYFAVYHALCHSNAQSLAGNLRSRRPDDWSRVYMGMDENAIMARFREYRPKGSHPANDFGSTFAILQEHRDRAMERPHSTFRPSEVARLIQRAESAIVGLLGTGAEEQRSWPSTCWSETCMARVPTSSPRRTQAGLPMDDGRGIAKRSAVRNGNVPDEIRSPRVMVTRRHAGHYLGMPGRR